jgi:segregation and condensation protein B
MSLSSAVECLLFVAGEPLSLTDLAKALQCDELTAEEALRDLQLDLGEHNRGLQVVSIAGGYQLSTKMEHAEAVGRLLARGASKLSRAGLETLAIIAYRQPVTQPEIEAVRGVSSGGVVKTLLERRLIAEAGRKQAVGRPILYTTTPEFLHYFAIRDLGELPPLDEAEAGTVAALVDGPVTPVAEEPPSQNGIDSEPPSELAANERE